LKKMGSAKSGRTLLATILQVRMIQSGRDSVLSGEDWVADRCRDLGYSIPEEESS
jgi:hypothetical protein